MAIIVCFLRFLLGRVDENVYAELCFFNDLKAFYSICWLAVDENV